MVLQGAGGAGDQGGGASSGRPRRCAGSRPRWGPSWTRSSTASRRACRSSWPRRARRWRAGSPRCWPARWPSASAARVPTSEGRGGAAGAGRARSAAPARHRRDDRGDPPEGLGAPRDRRRRASRGRRRRARLAAAPGVGGAWSAAYLFVFPYFAALNNPNENVRVWATRAIAHHGTFAIDPVMRRVGRRRGSARSSAGSATPARRRGRRCWGCRCTSSTIAWPGR